VSLIRRNERRSQRLSPAIANERKAGVVPLGRYLLVVGSFLLAMLFVAEWYFPNPAQMQDYGSPLDETALRIQSARKWPQRIQFDTAARMLAPSTASAAAAAAPQDPNRKAFAEMPPPEKTAMAAAPKPKPRLRRRRNPDVPARYAVNPAPQNWAWGW
jgi:hypothetical protein